MKLVQRLRIGRAISRSRAPSPFGALLRGLVAGAIGAGIQSLFFKATASLAPEPTKLPPGVGKPEPEAQKESSLETIARRLAEGMMQRGPLQGDAKTRAASVVHYSFGALWGGLYALVRESTALSPSLFGAAVWLASDNLILPAFRLAAWPQRYSLREHHYAVHAHLVYGLGTAGAYALLRDLGPVPLAALPAVLALQAKAWLRNTPPGRLLSHNHGPVARFFDQVSTRVARA